jgi:hypothetical protein
MIFSNHQEIKIKVIRVFNFVLKEKESFFFNSY